MKAVVLEGIGRVSVKEVEEPRTGPDDLLLRVDACGICGSDLRIIGTGNKRVRYPQIIGHEVAGRVAEVGANQENNFVIGERIALSADIPCGSCEWCQEGMSNHCKNNIAFGHEIPGGFAEYLLLNKRMLSFGPWVKVTDSEISQDELSLSEPLACCLNGLELSRFKRGKSVLIFGAGPVGCLLAKASRSFGASSVVLCDINPERVTAARVCRADRTILFETGELDLALKEFTNKKGFDIIFTACPSIEAQKAALSCVRNRGVINLFGGLPAGEHQLAINPNELHYREITVLGSHGSTPEYHKRAVKMIVDGDISVKELISKKFPLEDFGTALEEASSNKRNLKIVINPGGYK